MRIQVFRLTAPLLALVLLSTSSAAAAGSRWDDPDRPNRAAASGTATNPYRTPGAPSRYPKVGREVRSLPSGHVDVRVGGNDYRYHGGVFYRPRPDGAYVVVRPPIGARVSYLPPGYVSFGIGPSRYFYFDATYYLWDEPRQEYVVVEEPAGAEQALAATTYTSGELFIYPSQGQSDEQRERDRYECYLWASDQTGFDPGSADARSTSAEDYQRALSACLEGRGYTVR